MDNNGLIPRPVRNALIARKKNNATITIAKKGNYNRKGVNNLGVKPVNLKSRLRNSVSSLPAVKVLRRPIKEEVVPESMEGVKDEIDLRIDAFFNNLDQTSDFDIKEFLLLQKEIRNIKPEYRTMGPEFEFAKLDIESIPLHVELAKSNELINGLPVVIETDAGNVIELAAPPFVISTSMTSWEDAKRRSVIITDKFERTLKNISNQGIGKLSLDGLIDEVSILFGVTFNKTEVAKNHKDSGLTKFTKGMSTFANGVVTEDNVSNAQINLKMTTNEIGTALRNGGKGNGMHMFLKGTINNHLFKDLKSKDTASAFSMDRLAIISYFVSQIPLMTLQQTMNAIRANVAELKPEENRDAFKSSHPSNQKLLMKLSQVKDYLGFWIKASLGDMMNDDPNIRELVSQIDVKSLKDVLINNTKKVWQKHHEGLNEFCKKYHGQELPAEIYDQFMTKIIENLTVLTREGGTQPKKIDIPNYGNPENSLIDYKNGAPFMARPDTYVPLKGGSLVEVRGLNKKVADNAFMRGFQMPYYRIEGKLAKDSYIQY